MCVCGGGGGGEGCREGGREGGRERERCQEMSVCMLGRGGGGGEKSKGWADLTLSRCKRVRNTCNSKRFSQYPVRIPQYCTDGKANVEAETSKTE